MADIMMKLSNSEASALRHLLAWLASAEAEGRVVSAEDLASEFPEAELALLADIRAAFVLHESRNSVTQ